jgi:hypothetical protein
MAYSSLGFGTEDAFIQAPSLQRTGLESGVKFLERRPAMFDAKNNRMLDSMYFRFLLTTGGFLAWCGAGYLLLSL